MPRISHFIPITNEHDCETIEEVEEQVVLQDNFSRFTLEYTDTITFKMKAYMSIFETDCL